ncbi:MAG TPA: hypothetical protein VKY42_12025 [Trueperaceae bacterium]|nr:hypothetical protein [Trueperaceae bacterium]
METTVTASFDHPSAAEDAASALVQAGLQRSDVLVFPADSDEVVRALRMASPNHEHRAVVPPEVGSVMGFTLGFLGGGFFGLLMGAGALNIMGREPAMAAGPFWSAVIGAVVLGAAGALCGFLFNAPLPSLDPAPERPAEPRLTVVSAAVPADAATGIADALAERQPRDLRVWRRTPAGWVPA